MSDVILTFSEKDKKVSYTLHKDLTPFQTLTLIGLLNLATRELQDKVIEKTISKEAKL